MGAARRSGRIRVRRPKTGKSVLDRAVRSRRRPHRASSRGMPSGDPGGWSTAIGARGPGGVSADREVAPVSASPAGRHADAAPCPGQDPSGTGAIDQPPVRPVASVHTSRKGGMVAEEGLEPPTRGL